MNIDDSTKIKKSEPLSFFKLSLLSVIIGVVAGFGAVIFRAMVAFVHNLMFTGKLSISYNAGIHTPTSIWGPLVVFVPVAGALGVAFLVKRYAPETKGTGVPEVIDAIYYKKGIVQPFKAAVKSLASALSLGSGASVGREGPIIQIGSAFGSTIGQFIPMSAWQRITLVAAGAGGGIAATFNTPVGGMLFATEIMLHEVSVRTLVPVAIASATGAYIGQNFFSAHPAFEVPFLKDFSVHIANPWVLISYIGLGILAGLFSAISIKTIYSFEDFFDKHIKGNYYTRHALGMFIVGIIMYIMMRIWGQYYVEGIGYATIQDILTGRLSILYLLVLLAVVKTLVVSISLGSGASGGIFSPHLYIGAALGGAYGIFLSRLFPGLPFSAPAFAVAGMAGLISGSTGAAIAAIIMIFEMTLDYNALIPMTITVAVSYGIRRLFVEETVYTLKIVRRGHSLPKSLQTNYYLLKHARNVMETNFLIIPASRSQNEFAQMVAGNAEISHFLVEEAGKISGYLTRDAALAAFTGRNTSDTVGEMARTDFFAITGESNLSHVVDGLRDRKASLVLVTRDQETATAESTSGFITKEDIVDSMESDFEIFSGQTE